MTDAKLYGDDYSWVATDSKGKVVGYNYTTNQGSVLVSPEGELISCIYAIGRNQGNTQLEIQIERNKFRISKVYYASPIQDELINDKSMSRSHAGRILADLDVNVVLRTLLMDDHFSYSSIVVKQTLYKLIVSSCKLNNEGKELCKEILKSWRKPIIQPKIVRTPILMEEK